MEHQDVHRVNDALAKYRETGKVDKLTAKDGKHKKSIDIIPKKFERERILLVLLRWHSPKRWSGTLHVRKFTDGKASCLCFIDGKVHCPLLCDRPVVKKADDHI